MRAKREAFHDLCLAERATYAQLPTLYGIPKPEAVWYLTERAQE